MSTPTDIITAAMGYSLKNRPEQITARAAEFFALVNRTMRAIYSFAPKINYRFFGTSVAVNFAAGGWTRPVTAEAIWRIENPGKAEVIVVPREQLDADVARPAVYELGKSYFSAGNAADPTSGALTFFFSQKYVAPASFSTAFDATWDTDFDDIAILVAAIYLAAQDSRADEVQTLTAQLSQAVQRFGEFLEHETVNTVYAYGATHNYNVSDLVKTLLAGVAK